MPIERRCPTCSRDYAETATLCVNPSCNALDPPAPAALVPATAVPSASDEYTITKVLGWGGMATAYLATNRAGNTRVVKEMLPSGNPKLHAKLEKMFEREAQIQERLGHQLTTNPPAFPPFPIGEGAFRAHGRLFMAMEFMDGMDLDKVQDQVGAMPMIQVVQHGIEVCIILRDYLHGYREMGIVKPIIHRDIKPANIHLLKANRTACLLDFGIARFESYSAATMGRGGTRAGSPAFAMPEQLQKGRQISAFTDTGCLCATLWALIANAKEWLDTRPDQIQAIRTFVRDVELQAILIKGTDENSAGRYQSAEELRVELVRIYEAHRPLPAHLRPVIVPVAPAPPPAPAAAPPVLQPAGRYKIVWDKTPTETMPNGNEYQRVLTGKVIERHRFSRNQPVTQVNVVVSDIVDSPGGHPTGVSRVLTDASGYFHLDQIDTRVSNTVVERRLRIVVEETTGRPIHDESVVIKRPRTHTASQKAQKAGQWFKDHAGSFSSVKVMTGLAFLFLVATLALVWLQGVLSLMRYVWPHTWVAFLICGFLAFLMRERGMFTDKTRSLWQALKNPLVMSAFLIWVTVTLVYWLPK